MMKIEADRFLMGSEMEYSFYVKGKDINNDLFFYKNALSTLLRLSNSYSFLRPETEKWSRSEDEQFPVSSKLPWLIGDKFDRDIYIFEVGRFLFNGARFYVDSDHPEYSTPEVSNPRDLVKFEKSGEALLTELISLLENRFNAKVYIHKNNHDGRGNSYGYHSNYLLSRSLFDKLTGSPEKVFRRSDNFLSKIWRAFLVTSVPYTGAGKAGFDQSKNECFYQISQRADFFSENFELDTLTRRGLINTRDEPHARREDYGRFHVIFNDANMSEWQIWLKFGAQALFLKMLDVASTESLKRLPVLKDSLFVLPIISRDLSFKIKFDCEDGKSRTVIDIQKEFLEAMGSFCGNSFFSSQWQKQILEFLESVLAELDNNPSNLSDRFDWVAKKNFMDHYFRKRPFDFQKMKAMDLNYHNIKGGIYKQLIDAGLMLKMLDDEEIKGAITNPPEDTRAYFKSFLAKNYSDWITDIDWNFISLKLKFGPSEKPLYIKDLHPWDLNKNFIERHFFQSDDWETVSRKLLMYFLLTGEIVSSLGRVSLGRVSLGRVSFNAASKAFDN